MGLANKDAALLWGTGPAIRAAHFRRASGRLFSRYGLFLPTIPD
jgi:hypothetical protein